MNTQTQHTPTIETHQFWTKEEAEEKSESLKSQWGSGYGHITGPFQGGKIDGFKRYWEVTELLAVPKKKRNRFKSKAFQIDNLLKENEQLKEQLKHKQGPILPAMLEELEALNAELLDALKGCYKLIPALKSVQGEPEENTEGWKSYNMAKSAIAKAETKQS